MAFEADCGVSTVLEALRVTDTGRPLVPGECHGSLGASRAMQPGRLRYKATRIGLPFVGQAPRLPAGLVTAKPVGRSRMGGKFEIRNSIFEILRWTAPFVDTLRRPWSH